MTNRIPRLDADGDDAVDAVGSLTSPASIVAGENIYHIPEAESSGVAGDATRALRTTEPRTGTDALWVDASTGDDSIDRGTESQSNPLQTIQEALDRTPMFIEHEFEIVLTDTADHTSGTGSVASGPIFSHWNVTGVKPAFQIRGETGNPADVTVDMDGFGVQIFDPEPDNTSPDSNISDITFNGDINAKRAQLSISNCIFTGTRTDAGIKGKGDFTVMLDQCAFQTGLDYAATCVQPGAHAILRNCTGSTSEYTFRLRNGGRGDLRGNNEPIGNKGWYDCDNAAIFVGPSGTVYDPRQSFADDFGGNRLSERPSAASAHFRPDWSVVTGSPTIDGGVMTLPDGSGTTQAAQTDRTVPNAPGSLQFDVKWTTLPTSGRLYLFFLYATSSEFWRVDVQNGGSVSLDKEDGGVATNDVISGTPGFTADTWHNIQLTWDGVDTWELFFDGASQGTAVDSFLPDQGTADDWTVLARNLGDAEVKIRDLTYTDV